MYKKRNKKKILLLPIETMVRELDWKMILAALCLKKNNVIYIGQHNYLFKLARFIRNGIYIGKNSMSRGANGVWHSHVHKKLKKLGFTVIHLDEEGAVYHGDEVDWTDKLITYRVDVNALSFDDILFTWGAFQANVYKEHTKIPESNIHITGHPRFDLFKSEYSEYYKAQVSELRRKYNEFILVNCNFPMSNNILGLEDTFSTRMGYDLSDEDRQTTFIHRWSHTGKSQIEYIKMTLLMSLRYPNQNIVIRPHPAENNEIYLQAFKDVSNVQVVLEGAVNKWILACKLVIHDGSTTGLEAFFSQKPVINYSPFYHKKSCLYLPNSIGYSCKTIDEVFDAIDQLNSVGSIKKCYKSVSERAKSLLENLNQNESSFNIIVDRIAQIEKNQKHSSFNELFFNLYRLWDFCLEVGRAILRLPFKIRRKRNRAFNSIFPGFDPRDIRKKVVLLEDISGKKIQCKFINKKLMRLCLVD